MKRRIAAMLLCLTIFFIISICMTAPAVAQASYSVVRTIPMGGDGGWDYLYVDSTAHRVYIARSTRFMVVDLESSKLAGEIPDTPGAHGVALVPDLGIGFTTNGRRILPAFSISRL